MLKVMIKTLSKESTVSKMIVQKTVRPFTHEMRKALVTADVTLKTNMSFKNFTFNHQSYHLDGHGKTAKAIML